jgi:hypothetical protein
MSIIVFNKGESKAVRGVIIELNSGNNEEKAD